MLLSACLRRERKIDWPTGSVVQISPNEPHTVIRFVSSSAKFGICTVVGLNGTLFEAKIGTFKFSKCVFFSFNIYTHDGENYKFSIDWDENGLQYSGERTWLVC